jgi:hypothetical protein
MRNLQIRTLDRNNPEELPNFFDSLDYSHAPHWSHRMLVLPLFIRQVLWR